MDSSTPNDTSKTLFYSSLFHSNLFSAAFNSIGEGNPYKNNVKNQQQQKKETRISKEQLDELKRKFATIIENL